MNKALIIAAAAVPVYAVLDIYRFVFWRSRSRLSTLLLDKRVTPRTTMYGVTALPTDCGRRCMYATP